LILQSDVFCTKL